MDKKLKKFFKRKGFNVRNFGDLGGAEIETWTDMGTSVIVCLQPFTIETFVDYVNTFSIEKEINDHREDSAYRTNFSLEESLKDFKAYHKMLRKIAKKLQKVETPRAVTREEKILEQIKMQNEIVFAAKINLVNCGHCGSVMFHRVNEDSIECPFCDFKSEPCDFPDYFYEGLEVSKQFKENQDAKDKSKG